MRLRRVEVSSSLQRVKFVLQRFVSVRVPIHSTINSNELQLQQPAIELRRKPATLKLHSKSPIDTEYLTSSDFPQVKLGVSFYFYAELLMDPYKYDQICSGHLNLQPTLIFNRFCKRVKFFIFPSNFTKNTKKSK